VRRGIVLILGNDVLQYRNGPASISGAQQLPGLVDCGLGILGRR
jgi:hypothetical protein